MVMRPVRKLIGDTRVIFLAGWRAEPRSVRGING